MKQHMYTKNHNSQPKKHHKYTLHSRIMFVIFQMIFLIILAVFYLHSENKTEQNNNSFYASGRKEDNYGSSDQNRSSKRNPADSAAGSSQTDPGLLTLVNADHPLPQNYQIPITQLRNNQSVATVCYPDLQEMMDDCRAAGLQPLICSSYRSMEKQQTLFNHKVQSLMDNGYSQDDAYEKAATEIAIPGTSEHQLGLALDIVDTSNQRLEDGQEDTPVQQWLMANSWKYGFILRYPTDKSDITGIIYEPWHYRYVGKEAAEYIYRHDLCLEEYLDNK